MCLQGVPLQHKYKESLTYVGAGSARPYLHCMSLYSGRQTLPLRHNTLFHQVAEQKEGTGNWAEIYDTDSTVGQGPDFNGMVYGGKFRAQAADECVVIRGASLQFPFRPKHVTNDLLGEFALGSFRNL